MLISFDSCVRIAPDVLTRQVGVETVLLNLKSERYLGLDEVATRMWQVLTSVKSIKVGYENLLQEFDVDAERLRQDLDGFVQELVELGLVQVNAPP